MHGPINLGDNVQYGIRISTGCLLLPTKPLLQVNTGVLMSSYSLRSSNSGVQCNEEQCVNPEVAAMTDVLNSFSKDIFFI